MSIPNEQSHTNMVLNDSDREGLEHSYTNNCANNHAIATEINPNVTPQIGSNHTVHEINDVQALVSPTSNLIERLLQWSQLDSDEILDSCTFFCLDDVIADAIALISGLATSQGVQIIFEPTHGAFVYADEDMIYSMAQNLISNAVKFSYNGGIVKIVSELDQDMIKVAIANSGVNISQSQIHQLFQHQLFQLATGPASDDNIELLLCHRFAERNHGKLSVSSENGQGITFTFTLPKVV